jgi:hypothetical protein
MHCEGQPTNARLLLVSPDDDARQLAVVPHVDAVCLSSYARNSREALASAPYDLVALYMAPALFTELSAVLSDHDPLGFPEILFLCHQPGCPEHLALASSGLGNVLEVAHAAAWLTESLPGLTGLARGRRLIASARRAGFVALAPVTPDCRLRLGTAESRFREAYFRALLAKYHSRRAAADAAGVPYRSFCEMLRKLGLGDEHRQSQKCANGTEPGPAINRLGAAADEPI